MSEAAPAESEARALGQAFIMIIFSEIGDKTFLIAAILAMRHPRALVFAGAFGSLVVMSILSAAMGHLLPTLIPKQWTQFAAGVLFLVFGAKMVQEGRSMKSGQEKIQEEMKEVEEEIEQEDAALDGRAIPLEELEEGGRRGTHHTGDEMHESGSPPSPNHSRSRPVGGIREGCRNFCNLLLGPVFVQSFILTFLGEWGDRSQIATIALAAAHNIYVVALGTIVGHACCTAVAVLGGRWLSNKISIKHVTFGGSALFLIFSLIYFHEALTYADAPSAEILPGKVGEAWFG